MAIIIASNIIALSLIYLFSIKFSGGGGGLWPRFSLTIAGIFLVLLSFWPEVSGTIYIFQVVIGNLAIWWLLYVLLKWAVPARKSWQY